MLIANYGAKSLPKSNLATSLQSNRLFKMMNDAVETYQQDAQTNVRPVPNESVLVALCRSVIMPVFNKDFTNFHEAIKSAMATSPGLYGMVSDHGEGRDDNEWLYPEAKEHVIVTSDTALVNLRTWLNIKNWQKLKPLVVRSHDSVNLYPTFEGVTGSAYLEVKMDELVAMVNHWNNEQRLLDPEDRESIQDFVAKYIIPNALESHLECCLINAVLSKEDIVFEGRSARAYLNTVDQAMDYRKSLQDRLAVGGMMMHELTSIVLSHTGRSLLEILAVPSLAYTQNTAYWLVGFQIPVGLRLLSNYSVTDTSYIANSIRYLERSIQSSGSGRKALGNDGWRALIDQVRLAREFATT